MSVLSEEGGVWFNSFEECAAKKLTDLKDVLTEQINAIVTATNSVQILAEPVQMENVPNKKTPKETLYAIAELYVDRKKIAIDQTNFSYDGKLIYNVSEIEENAQNIADQIYQNQCKVCYSKCATVMDECYDTIEKQCVFLKNIISVYASMLSLCVLDGLEELEEKVSPAWNLTELENGVVLQEKTIADEMPTEIIMKKIIAEAEKHAADNMKVFNEEILNTLMLNQLRQPVPEMNFPSYKASVDFTVSAADDSSFVMPKFNVISKLHPRAIKMQQEQIAAKKLQKRMARQAKQLERKLRLKNSPNPTPVKDSMVRCTEWIVKNFTRGNRLDQPLSLQYLLYLYARHCCINNVVTSMTSTSFGKCWKRVFPFSRSSRLVVKGIVEMHYRDVKMITPI